MIACNYLVIACIAIASSDDRACSPGLYGMNLITGDRCGAGLVAMDTTFGEGEDGG